MCILEFRKHFKTGYFWNEESTFKTRLEYAIRGIGWLRICVGLVSICTATESSSLAGIYFFHINKIILKELQYKILLNNNL